MRGKSPMLLLAAMAAAAIPAAGAAQARCAPVQSVLVTISGAEPSDSVVTMRIRRPQPAERRARLNRDRLAWSLALPQPARLEAIDLEPLKAGHAAVPTDEKPSAQVRGGRCVAHFGFRFVKGWRVDVASEPANLPVQVIAENGRVDVARTDFITDPLPMSVPLKLRIGGLGQGELGARTLPLTIHHDQLRDDKPIRHDTSQIIRLLCGTSVRCQILGRKVTTRAIVIHRVES